MAQIHNAVRLPPGHNDTSEGSTIHPVQRTHSFPSSPEALTAYEIRQRRLHQQQHHHQVVSDDSRQTSSVTTRPPHTEPAQTSLIYHPMALFEAFSWPHFGTDQSKDVHHIHHHFSPAWLEHHNKNAHKGHHFQFPTPAMEHAAWGEQHPEKFVSSTSAGHIHDVHHGRHFQFPTPGMIKMAWGEQDSDSIGKWAPNTDIRDMPVAYHIEIELPGLTDKKDIKMYWMSPRALIVEGNVERPDLACGGAVEGEAIGEGPSTGSQTNGATTMAKNLNGTAPSEEDKVVNVHGNGTFEPTPPLRTTPTKQDVVAPKFLLAERQIGPWHRSFTLPAGVDMKGLKAKLDCGLLSIYLPKVEVSDAEKFPVKVEVQQENEKSQPQPWLGTL